MFTNLTTLLNELFKKDQHMLVLTRYIGQRVIFTDRHTDAPLMAVELVAPPQLNKNPKTRERLLRVYRKDGKPNLAGTLDYVDPIDLDHGVRIYVKPRNENGPAHGSQTVSIEAPYRVSVTREEIATPAELAPFDFPKPTKTAAPLQC